MLEGANCFFSSGGRHTRCNGDWSSDVCSSDLASAGGEAAVLQSFRKRMRAFLEIAVSQALFLALAIGFDQGYFVRILIQRVPQRFADGLIFRKVQHYRRD